MYSYINKKICNVLYYIVIFNNFGKIRLFFDFEIPCQTDRESSDKGHMEVEADHKPNTSVVSESKGSRKKSTKKIKNTQQEKKEKRKAKLTAKPDKKQKLESSDTAVK